MKSEQVSLWKLNQIRASKRPCCETGVPARRRLSCGLERHICSACMLSEDAGGTRTMYDLIAGAPQRGVPAML